MVQREAAYAALHQRIDSALPPGWNCSRIYKDFDDHALALPACLVLVDNERGQTPIQERNRPTKWQLAATIIIYYKQTDPSITVETALNEVIDTVVDALRITPAEMHLDHEGQTTLGGVVERAWISGSVRVFTGIPGGMSIVTLPIEMLQA